MMKELLKLSLSIILLGFYGCTVNVPIIRENDWDITIVNDIENKIIYERLSIFLNCYDEDGLNDIETIMFIDDENGIYWELNRDNWEDKTIDDVRWLGSSNIVMPDRSSIPRVKLRAFVRDMAGESVESSLYIAKKSIDIDEIIYPTLNVDNNTIELAGADKASLEVVINNEIYATGEISQGVNSISEVFKLDDDESFSLKGGEIYATTKYRNIEILSGPWFLE